MKMETGIHTENKLLLKPDMWQKNSLWTTCTWWKQTVQLWLKLLQFNGSNQTAKNPKKVVKFLEEWAAKILCQDNNYVQNLANADEETKKCFQSTKKHLPYQYAPSNTSYNPNNQEASNNVNIVQFTPEQQWHKTPDQLYLHLCDLSHD